MTFQDLGLCPEILSALEKLGYEKPSPIQEKAIPPALQGRDVLGCAQTGTGKTCAFATPILQRLKAHPAQGRPIRALILTPTRELALQIQESFEHYGKNLPLRSAVIFGGVGQQPQVDKLKAGVDILVATPGRLQDLHNQGFIHVEKLEIFVLDEADRMLDMGFIHDVKKILTWLPRKKQTLFFSATMPPEVQGLVDQLLTDPVKVAVDPVSSPVEVIDQRLFYVDRGNKSKLLSMLIKHPDVKNALIFTRTKHGANKVAADLQKAGIPSAAIHGNKSQTARQQALSDFKSGRVKALVATDIAARGIDIEELSHVFNYNLPDVPETYVHRIGRTGRAGHGGTAVSFCEFGEKELLAPIEKLLKKPIPVVEGHPFPMENFEAPKRDKHGKIVNADDQEARQAARERKKLREEARRAGEAKKAEPLAQKAPAPQRRRQEQKAQPRQGKQVSGQPARKVPAAGAQTPAAGKRAAPGYRASRTLDEALTAMAPGKKRTPKPAPASSASSSDRSAAFEAWLAEERAIQAKKFRNDPAAGGEIMDATARLLAPKDAAAVPPQRQPDQPRQQSQRRETRPNRQKQAQSQKQNKPAQPRQETKRKHSRIGELGPERGRGKGQMPEHQPESQGLPSRREQSDLTDGACPPRVKRPGYAANASVTSPRSKSLQQSKEKAQPKQREQRRPNRRGRGPMEVTLRLGDQKDSTEQSGSLMRPYYFSPDED